MTYSTVSVQEVYKKLQQGQAVFLDVRTPAEFRAAHAQGARNLPLDQLDPGQLAQQLGAIEPVYVICHKGGRSHKACQALGEKLNIVDVQGGTQAWIEAGLPVVRGQRAMSLERQVRIAAGSLIFVGSALGYFVHPFWISLPAVIGAGLAYAGLVDSCAMGMILARMPWNRVSTGDPGSASAQADHGNQAAA